MYTVDELLLLDKPAKLNKVSLKLIQDLYDSEIIPYSYVYTLSNGTILDIKFYRENLCHLLGIQKVAPREMKKHYSGAHGYDKIQDESITLQSLIKMDQEKFNFIEIRIAAFHLIFNLLRTCKVVKFYPERTSRGTDIRSNFILYDEVNEIKLHLGVIKEENTNIYVPETFIVKSLKAKDKNYFTDMQQYLQVKTRTITLINDKNSIAAS